MNESKKGVFEKHWLGGLGILGGWTLYALLFFGHQLLLTQSAGDWQRVFLAWMIGGLCWALLIIWLARRLVIARARWLLNGSIHLVIGILFPNLVYLLAGAVFPIL